MTDDARKKKAKKPNEPLPPEAYDYDLDVDPEWRERYSESYADEFEEWLENLDKATGGRGVKPRSSEFPKTGR